MISEELKTIVDRLNKKGEMAFLSATTDEKIFEFEEKYNVSLPQKYKEWLKFSDGGEFFLPAGVQMYGVEHKPFINVEDPDKPDDKYIVIGALASGDPILCDKTSEQISIYNHEAGRIEEDEVYESFIEFLNDLYDMLGIGG